MSTRRTLSAPSRSAAWSRSPRLAFETLELLEGTDEPDFDLAEALELLELLWLDKLTPADRAYNAR